MPDGTAANVGLGDLAHLDGAHDATVHAGLLEGVLQGEGVDDGGEHAHVVSLGAVHAISRTLDATVDVAATDYDSDLDAGLVDRANLLGKP